MMEGEAMAEAMAEEAKAAVREVVVKEAAMVEEAMGPAKGKAKACLALPGLARAHECEDTALGSSRLPTYVDGGKDA